MTHSDRKQEWLEEYYGRVDSMNPGGFLPMIAEDATVTLGNSDPVVGRENIAGAFGGLMGAVRSCRHILHSVHDLDGDLAAVEGEMGLVRQDGKELSLRFAAFFEIGGDGMFHEQRLFVDFTPLFA